MDSMPAGGEPITLASASPRRREILTQMGLPFRVRPAEVDEKTVPGEPVEEAAARLSREKVEACIARYGRETFRWVLGADTLIELDGRPVGKPKDLYEASEMLRRFSGRTHRVVTGLSLYSASRGMILTERDVSEVRFAPLSDEEIAWYADTGEWRGAAGGYRIQERGACLIECIAGSYSTVMGLPIRTFYGMLRATTYPFI